MYVQIKSTPEKIYEQVLTFMNPFYNLTPNEIKVVAAILRLYKETEGAQEKIRWGYVFSTEGKDQIKDATGMDTNKLNLTFTGLRKKTFQGEPILLKEPIARIQENLCIDPMNYSEITVEFILPDHEAPAPAVISEVPETVVPEPEDYVVLENDPETEGDYPEDREEIPDDWDPSITPVGEPVHTHTETHRKESEKGERDLPPGFRTSYYD